MLHKRFSTKDEVYSLVDQITFSSERLDCVEVLDLKVQTEQVNGKPFHEVIMPIEVTIDAYDGEGVSLELQLSMAVNDGTALAELPQKVLDMLQARHFSIQPRRPAELATSHSLNFKKPQYIEDFLRAYEDSEIPLKFCLRTLRVWVDYQEDRHFVVYDLMQALSNALDPVPLHVAGRKLFSDKVRGEFLDALIDTASNQVKTLVEAV